MFSISISVLRKSHDFHTVDLASETDFFWCQKCKGGSCWYHEIVLAWTSPFLIPISSALQCDRSEEWMFHVRYGELYLSVDTFSHSRVDDVFAADRGPYRIQHSGNKPWHQKRLIAGAPTNHVHVCPVLRPALYSTLMSTVILQHLALPLQ